MRRTGGSRWDGLATRGPRPVLCGLTRGCHRQPFAPLGAAAFKHEPAVLGAHADEKAMRPLAATPVRLERALHDVGPLQTKTDERRNSNSSQGATRVSTNQAPKDQAC